MAIWFHWLIFALATDRPLGPTNGSRTSSYVDSHTLNSKLSRPQGVGPERRSTYESGIEPMGDARIQFNIRCYICALVFSMHIDA